MVRLAGAMSTKTWAVPPASADGHAHEDVSVSPRPRPMGMSTKAWACFLGLSLGRWTCSRRGGHAHPAEAGSRGSGSKTPQHQALRLEPVSMVARAARIGQADFLAPDPRQ